MNRIGRQRCPSLTRSFVNYACAVAVALSFVATSIHANEPSLPATQWTSISTPSSPAKLSLQAAPTITLDHTRRFILRTVAKLNNYTQKPIELEVPNSCQVFRWEIVDADGNRIIPTPAETKLHQDSNLHHVNARQKGRKKFGDIVGKTNLQPQHAVSPAIRILASSR